MEGWTKYFIDSTSENGSDKLIEAGKASWRRGRLDGMVAADISNGKVTVSIGSPAVGQFWQSDTFISSNVGTKCIERRVERYISKEDFEANLYIYIRKKGIEASVLLVPFIAKPSELHSAGFEQYCAITRDLVGQWIIAELNDKEVSFYITKDKK